MAIFGSLYGPKFELALGPSIFELGFWFFGRIPIFDWAHMILGLKSCPGKIGMGYSSDAALYLGSKGL